MNKGASGRQISRWRTLSRRKGRGREGVFLIEGERAVRQVLSNGVLQVESVLLEEGVNIPMPEAKRVVELDVHTFRSISCAETPQGVMAVATIPSMASMDVLRNKRGLLLATDAIQDPGNLGTLLRTALWFGVQGVLLGKGTVELWNPKVIRSTAGSTGMLPWITGDLNKLLSELEAGGWKSALLDIGDDSIPLPSFAASPQQILVVGNEGNGIQEELKGSARPSIRIEGQSEGVESLNAAIATGIALYSLTH